MTSHNNTHQHLGAAVSLYKLLWVLALLGVETIGGQKLPVDQKISSTDHEYAHNDADAHTDHAKHVKHVKHVKHTDQAKHAHSTTYESDDSKHLASGVASHGQEEQTGTKKKRIVIHIGPHKTGTTSFQRHLAQNHQLSPIMYYPDTCNTPTQAKGFHMLAKGLCPINNTSHKPPQVNARSCSYEVCKHCILPKQNTSKELQQQCPPHCANCNKEHPKSCSPFSKGFFTDIHNATGGDLVISTETFDSCTVESFMNLKEIFMDFEVHVVAVRRDSRTTLFSRFHQVDKNYKKNYQTFEEYYANWDKQPCEYVAMECVNMLSSVFGASNTHIISYEGMVVGNKDLVEMMCTIFSLDCETEKTRKRQKRLGYSNKSPPHSTYSALTAYNHLSNISKKCTEIRGLGRATEKMSDFYNILTSAGVMERCTAIPWYDCDECFQKAMISRTPLDANAYLFEKANTSRAMSLTKTTFCEFDGWMDTKTLELVIKEMEKLFCP